MDQKIAAFIEENINLIQRQKWEEIYEKEFPTGLTETLLNCGINPLDQGLNYIPKYFLHNCKSIKEFTIPDSVKSIGYSAFSSCDSLTNITIPNSVTNIGNDVFYDCNSLQNITIGNGVIRIGSSAFEYCDSLTSITIPDSVTSIGSFAFSDCSSLTSIEIPNSVTSIGDYAFAYCTSLTSVNYTGTIDEWVNIDFSDSYSNPTLYTRDLYINNTLVNKVNITLATKIEAFAFYNCNSLTSVVIGNSVTSIGEWAFCDCSSLISIEIPNNVIDIDNYAFLDCKSLTEIRYLGTKKEAMKLGIGNKSRKKWREGSSISKIICTDGEIVL